MNGLIQLIAVILLLATIGPIYGLWIFAGSIADRMERRAWTRLR